MEKVLLLSTLCLTLIGCHSRPFKVKPLAVTQPKKIAFTEDRFIGDLAKVLNETMADRYKKANSPSFALIKGFYRLPTTKPFGAASVVRGYSYQTYFEAIDLTSNEKNYGIEPISGDDAISFDKGLNNLLDAGVNIKDITMSDALNIAKAEANSAKNNRTFQPQKLLPLSVDYLMSIYPANSAQGPVLIGRVIKKNGSLLAFRVLDRRFNRNLVSELIVSLFEDTIKRI